jgi:hypothetical protein
VSDSSIIVACVYNRWPGMGYSDGGICMMFAHVMECEPVVSDIGLIGWKIPKLQGKAVTTGWAAWVRFVLPNGVMVDAPIEDFGLKAQKVEVGDYAIGRAGGGAAIEDSCRRHKIR